ncbi:dolichyl-P-Man:Man(7)GlcNAc(2)-PP-dolichol alpha-1,6-mannosyltransferase [Serendipita sp. 399]|nr:dolichyl-P-Man:Man(7)GlcNAc(2)-PP-dolichol alpha-1,6-mannosyltransferase [Serendipita sp. 399]
MQINKLSVSNATIHICNLAAQTGGSLFLQEYSPPYILDNRRYSDRRWIYDKTEGEVDLRRYTHAIVEERPPIDWNVNATVDAFDGLSKEGIKYSPKLWVITNPELPSV